MLEKIAVMLVTSSADRPQIYSERVQKLSGLWRQLQFHRQLQVHQQVNHLLLQPKYPSHRIITSRFVSAGMETTWICSETALTQDFCLRAPSTMPKSV